MANVASADEIQLMLKHSGFGTYVRRDGVRVARSAQGKIELRDAADFGDGRRIGAVAIVDAKPKPYAGPELSPEGNVELIKSDQHSEAVRLARNLRSDPVEAWRARGLSTAYYEILVRLQNNWRKLVTRGSSQFQDRVQGGPAFRDPNWIDAANQLWALYSLGRAGPRKEKFPPPTIAPKWWLYLTDMTLEGRHIAEIAKSRNVEASSVRRSMLAALKRIDGR